MYSVVWHFRTNPQAYEYVVLGTDFDMAPNKNTFRVSGMSWPICSKSQIESLSAYAITFWDYVVDTVIIN